jgi:hypothetical protein
MHAAWARPILHVVNHRASIVKLVYFLIIVVLNHAFNVSLVQYNHYRVNLNVRYVLLVSISAQLD